MSNTWRPRTDKEVQAPKWPTKKDDVSGKPKEDKKKPITENPDYDDYYDVSEMDEKDAKEDDYF